ncbi:alpha/beta fold hydrolase [Lewinella sp. W8]|uniref:alpha/beta hydrolase family protein n=1 Tax=Lewinella sp. W8 TaxID=2528208 RepID=UPI0010688CFB|nr:alpha/beta fold hydrolase [Lewinella sp. W8]MTB52075.1 alpha/beta fold hydrolase [Lewinella sp. W8]
MQETEIKIQCSDGVKLSGTLFEPSQAKAAVMIAPATGIKRQFYRAFAKHLVGKGFAVVTFDNRGIGQSLQGAINAGDPSLINWGTLDMTAVLDDLMARYPGQDYHLVGHSAGGQLVGLMKNATALTSMFNFASSSGSIHNAEYPFKIKSAFYLNFFIPVSNLLFGHTKSQWVGMGEPLPKNVSREWSRWCNGKGYVKVDLDTKIKDHLYDQLEFPSLWVHATDDDIANYDNVKDMVRVFSKMNAEIITLSPQAYGFKYIGHMKFFSKRRSALWALAVDWLEKN